LSSGGARTSRQPGHFHVSTVVRQVISCELCEGPNGASQGRSFIARAFDLARPGVAPPLGRTNYRRTAQDTAGQHRMDRWRSKVWGHTTPGRGWCFLPMPGAQIYVTCGYIWSGYAGTTTLSRRQLCISTS